MEHHLTWTDDLLPDNKLPGSYALLSDEPTTDTAVIFFHGFWGDAHETWLNFESMIDSHRTRYPEWDRSDLFFFQYSSFRRSISDIAGLVLKVVESIYPNPPTKLFELDVPAMGIPNVFQKSLDQHKYEKLLLVGHSEGGAVLRRAIEIAYKNKKLGKELAGATMNLFAPAHLGFEPKGWIGSCLSVARISQVAMTIFNASPAFVEMKEKTTLLNTATNTNLYAKESPDFKALRARVLIGQHDMIVVRGEFAYDEVLDQVPDQDHTSICKPRGKYLTPLTFAQGK